MEIVLSTAKAEYIALSTALREVVPPLTVMEEINEAFPLMMNPPNFYCKVWENNQSCIAMASSQKFTPWMKHIALKYQPFLVDCIVSFLGIKPQEYKVHCNNKFTPAAAQVLSKNLHGKPRKKSCKYRTAIGIMSYLQGQTRPDIPMPVHQTERFSNDPKLIDKKAITLIGQYLLGRREKGIKYKIDQSKGLELR
jgi:hypothetical protein